MNIPSSVVTSIRNSMFSAENSRNVYSCITLEDNKEFNRSLIIPVYKNKTFFIPSFGLSKSISFLDSWIHKKDTLDYKNVEDACIGINLYSVTVSTIKTSSSIINTINKYNDNSHLVKIDTAKGYSYYGGKGIILDENWNVLMIAGYHVSLKEDCESIIIEEPVCYISPKVFISKDIISKYIINTIIPFVVNNEIYTKNCGLLNNIVYTSTYSKVSIVVKSLDYLITEPVPPVSYNEDDNIWNFLGENIDELTCQ